MTISTIKRRYGATFMYVDGLLVDAIKIAQMEIEKLLGVKMTFVDVTAFIGKKFLDEYNAKNKNFKEMQIDALQIKK